MNDTNETITAAVLDDHERLMTMAGRELDHKIRALNAAARVLTGKNDAKGALAPGGATPAEPRALIQVGDWLLDELALADDTD